MSRDNRKLGFDDADRDDEHGDEIEPTSEELMALVAQPRAFREYNKEREWRITSVATTVSFISAATFNMSVFGKAIF